jgi:hypothetical protein
LRTVWRHNCSMDIVLLLRKVVCLFCDIEISQDHRAQLCSWWRLESPWWVRWHLGVDFLMFRPAMQIWEFFNHFKILGKSWGALLLPSGSHFHWNEWNWQFFRADFSFLKKTITRFSLILENFKNTCPALVASYIVFWYLDKTGYGRSRIFVTQAFNKTVSALFWGCVLLKLEDFSFTWQGRQISGPSICKIWHGPYSGPLPRIWVQTRGSLAWVRDTESPLLVVMSCDEEGRRR